MGKQVYRITHHYHVGNWDVFIESETDPTDAAIYCQLLAEEESEDPSVEVSLLGIASALVHFYGCRHTAAYPDGAKTIDMYQERTKRWNDWWIKNRTNSPLERKGLFEYLKPHICD